MESDAQRAHAIPADVAGVWLASFDQILTANETAKDRAWGARFARETIERVIDARAVNLVVPLLINDPLSSEGRSYRCLISFKRMGRNERRSTLMDFSDAAVRALARPSEARLHLIVRGLIEADTQVDLNTLLE
jgi:hypothetical protein